MPKDKGIKLKDILEDEPQEFTVMSDRFVERQKDAGCLVTKEKDKARCLSAGEYVKNGRQGDYIRCNKETGQPRLIQTQLPLKFEETERDIRANEWATLVEEGFIEKASKSGLILAGYASGIKGHGYNRRVYHPEGKAPSLCAASGGNLEPKILQTPRGANKGGLKAGDGKTPSLTTSSWEHNNHLTYDEGLTWRKLTPIECERLQTVPDNYTEGVSNTQRYKMLGNGWTVDVIAHILKGLA
jgi:site-specific DNA-cytosine methylase